MLRMRARAPRRFGDGCAPSIASSIGHPPRERFDAMRNTWHQAFEAAARRVPDAIALVASDRCLTYGELNRRANRLARVLRARCDAGPESLVGIVADHTIEGVIGVIAILKTGAGYVPLDPRYP